MTGVLYGYEKNEWRVHQWITYRKKEDRGAIRKGRPHGKEQ